MQMRLALKLPRIRGVLDFKGFSFAGFLSAGYFKADPRLAWVPIDLTVLFAGLTIVCVFFEFQKSGRRVHKNLYWMILLFALFAFSIFWTAWTSYASDKVQRFYTLTLIAAIAPFFLFKTREDLRKFVSALTLLGLILSWNAAIELVTSGGQIDRLTSFGSNTIALGRGAGMAFMWIAVLALERRIGVLLSIAALGLLGIVMLGSGSRGPLLAAIGGLLLLGIFHYWRHRKGFLRFFSILLLVGTVFAFGMASAPTESVDRITGLLHGQVDTSAKDRIGFYQLSMQSIEVKPLGLGWGGFGQLYQTGGDTRQYPHNILLEVFLEEGWIPGLFFLGLLAAVLPRSLLKSKTPEARVLFALLTFFLVNALVSGDLNDNKELFAFLALSLRYGSEKREPTESGASDLRPSSF